MNKKEIEVGSRVIIRSCKYDDICDHIGVVANIISDKYTNVTIVVVMIKGHYYYFDACELEAIDEPPIIERIINKVIPTIRLSTDKVEINSLMIKDIIFNDPATIILWKDGTKTVVKCSENDEYDPEKGMAMAICKKVLGNKGNYYSIFSKWLPEETEDNNSFKSVVDAFNNLTKMTRNIGSFTAAGINLKTAASSIQGIANVEKNDIKISSEPNLITYREYIEKKYPEKCSMDSNGGIIACPGSYIRTGPTINAFDCKFNSDNNACTKCFDQFIPLGSIDLKTGKPIYKEKNK